MSFLSPATSTSFTRSLKKVMTIHQTENPYENDSFSVDSNEIIPIKITDYDEEIDDVSHHEKAEVTQTKFENNYPRPYEKPLKD